MWKYAVAIILISALFDCKGKGTEAKIIQSIKASSTLKDAKGRYRAEWLVDGNAKTSWVEGKAGDGIGETIEINFVNEVTISSFKINNGFGDAAYYATNNRVKELAISGSDGRETVKVLADTPETQEIKLEKPVKGKNISLKIVSVYKSTKDRDTAISEIMFENAKNDSQLAAKLSDYERTRGADSFEGLYQQNHGTSTITFLHIRSKGDCEIVSYSHAAGARMAAACTWKRSGSKLQVDDKTFTVTEGKLSLEGKLAEGDQMKLDTGAPILGDTYSKVEVRAENEGSYMDNEGKKVLHSE